MGATPASSRPTVGLVETYAIAEAAERAGLRVEELGRLVELGILKPRYGRTLHDG